MCAPRSQGRQTDSTVPLQGSRRLLLVMSLVLTGARGCDAVDFGCTSKARVMLHRLMDGTAISDDSDRLPRRIQLPCIRVHKASWDKKTVQQRGALVLTPLQVLLEAVKLVEGESELPDQKSLLRRLRHHMENYVLIVRHLQVIQAGPPQDDCRGQQTLSLRRTLRHYQDLLRGRLGLLLGELRLNCPQQGPDP